MIIPVGANVLIKPFKDEITYGRIHLPDTAKAKATDGIVFAVGNRVSEAINIGDWVTFSRKQAHDYHNIETDEHFIIVRESAIATVLTEGGMSDEQPPEVATVRNYLLQRNELLKRIEEKSIAFTELYELRQMLRRGPLS